MADKGNESKASAVLHNSAGGAAEHGKDLFNASPSSQRPSVASDGRPPQSAPRTTLSAATPEFKMPNRVPMHDLASLSPVKHNAPINDKSAPRQSVGQSKLRNRSKDVSEKKDHATRGDFKPSANDPSTAVRSAVAVPDPRRLHASNAARNPGSTIWTPRNTTLPAQSKAPKPPLPAANVLSKGPRDLSQAWVLHRRKHHGLSVEKPASSVRTGTPSLTVTERLDETVQEIATLRESDNPGTRVDRLAKDVEEPSRLRVFSELEGTPRGSSEEDQRPSHSSAVSQSETYTDPQAHLKPRNITKPKQFEVSRTILNTSKGSQNHNRWSTSKELPDPDFDRSLPVRKGSLGQAASRSRLFEPDKDLAESIAGLGLAPENRSRMEQSNWSQEANWRMVDAPSNLALPEGNRSWDKTAARGRNVVNSAVRDISQLRGKQQNALQETDGTRLFDHRKDDPLKYQSPVTRMPVSTQAISAHNEPWFDDRAVVSGWAQASSYLLLTLPEANQDLLNSSTVVISVDLLENALQRLDECEMNIRKAMDTIKKMSEGDVSRDLETACQGYQPWAKLVQTVLEQSNRCYGIIMLIVSVYDDDESHRLLAKNNILERLWKNGYLDVMTFSRSYLMDSTDEHDLRSTDPLLIELASELMTCVAIEQYFTYLSLFTQLSVQVRGSRPDTSASSSCWVLEDCLERLSYICMERTEALVQMGRQDQINTDTSVVLSYIQWRPSAVHWNLEAARTRRKHSIFNLNLSKLLQPTDFKVHSIFFLVKSTCAQSTKIDQMIGPDHLIQDIESQNVFNSWLRTVHASLSNEHEQDAKLADELYNQFAADFAVSEKSELEVQQYRLIWTMRAAVDVAVLLHKATVLGEEPTPKKLSADIRSFEFALQVIWATFCSTSGTRPEDEPHVYHLIILQLLVYWTSKHPSSLSDDRMHDIPWTHIVAVINSVPSRYWLDKGSDTDAEIHEGTYLPLDDLLRGFEWCESLLPDPTEEDTSVFNAEYFSDALGNLEEKIAFKTLTGNSNTGRERKRRSHRSEGGDKRVSKSMERTVRSKNLEALYQEHAWRRLVALAERLVQTTDALQWDSSLRRVILSESFASASTRSVESDAKSRSIGVKEVKQMCSVDEDAYYEEQIAACERQYRAHSEQHDSGWESSVHGLPGAFQGATALSGYTYLVVDSTVLIYATEYLKEVIKSGTWTVVAPLAAIGELDALLLDGDFEEAQKIRDLLEFLDSVMRQGGKSFKVLTSKGNYLSNLMIRNEDIDFATASGKTKAKKYESKLAELMLTAVKWQSEHFVDRASVLGVDLTQAQKRGAARSCIATFNCHLRHRAHREGLRSLSNAEIGSIIRDLRETRSSIWADSNS